MNNENHDEESQNSQKRTNHTHRHKRETWTTEIENQRILMAIEVPVLSPR